MVRPRKLLSALVPALAAGMLASFAARAAPAPFSICVVHNNADHPSITAIVNGMNDEAAIYNAHVTYFDPAFDPQKQAAMIEDCIARKPNVIAVNAVDPAAVVPGLKKASEAGIPVIMQNADTNDAGHAYSRTYVGSQTWDQGYAVGQMIAKAVPKGNMVIISGKPGQTGVAERIDGMKQALVDGKADLKILAIEPAEWSKDKALTLMQDLLTRYAHIDVVYGLDDPMALGALEAIKAAGREGEMKVYGVNGNKDACAAIKNKEMGGTALQLSYLVGVYTVRAAYDIVQGRQVPRQILAPTAPVTADNIDSWMSQCW